MQNRLKRDRLTGRTGEFVGLCSVDIVDVMDVVDEDLVREKAFAEEVHEVYYVHSSLLVENGAKKGEKGRGKGKKGKKRIER